jgi:RNA polymerase sigma-B factor
VQELAQYMEIRVEDVLDALEAGAAHHSTPLDAPVGRQAGERATLADTFGAEDDRFELIDARLTLGAVASELSERERVVLSLYFLEERTQSEIAAEIGISQMQVSRILRRTIERLRELTEHDVAPSRAR